MTADEPPLLSHPEMARIYRTKVTELASARTQPDAESKPLRPSAAS